MFSYNGSILRLATLHAKNSTPLNEDIEKGIKDKEREKVKTLEDWFELNIRDKIFHRNQDEKDDYETILGEMHKSAMFKKMQEVYEKYSRSSIYQTGTRQVYNIIFFKFFFIFT